MRVAVIGTGSMGGMHAALLADIGAEVLVVDTDAARAAHVAARTGATPATLEDAISEADAVVVATPPDRHAEAVLPALAAGRSVLCEKPLAEDLAEATRIADAGGHLEVGFQRRHEPSFVAARQSVAGDRIHLVRLAALDPLVAPREPASWPEREAAPIFLHSSIHDFDFVRWVSGQEVVEVTADGSTRRGERPDDVRAVESATVLMRLSGGTLATLEATWLHPGGYDIRVELVTEREHLSVGLSSRTPARHLDWVAGERAAAWSGYLERFEAAYRNELVAFLAAARGEQEPASSGRDGIEALRIAVVATRSFVERRTVAVDEIRVGQAAA